MGAGVNEDDRPLPIFDQLLVRELFQISEELQVKFVGLIGIAAGLEDDHRLPQLHMPGFFRILHGVQLPDDHDAAEREHDEKAEGELVLADKVHLRLYESWRLHSITDSGRLAESGVLETTDASELPTLRFIFQERTLEFINHGWTQIHTDTRKEEDTNSSFSVRADS